MSPSPHGRFERLAERVRQSLFVIPALYVAGGIALAQAALAVGSRIDEDSLPEVFVTTVDSSRALLGAIAGGMITAGALVVTLTLVAVQLASTQFSPRSLRRFIGDRFQQQMIGVILGTFTYAVWVLRDVRGPLAEDGSPVVPHVAVTVAVVLAVAALLAVLASIDHTARSLRVGDVAEAVQAETIETIRRRFGTEPGLAGDAARDAPGAPGGTPRPTPAGTPSAEVRAGRAGWIQQIDQTALAASAPPEATLVIRTPVGTYLTSGQVVAEIHGAAARQETIDAAEAGVVVGAERTMQADVGFGIVRLQDIALRALSAGVNDPNTADEIVARLGDVLLELMAHDLEDTRERDVDGRRLEHAEELDHAAYVDLAFSAIRRQATDQPHVLATLVRVTERVSYESARRDLPGDRSRLDLHARLARRALASLDLAEDEMALVPAPPA